MRGKTLTFPSWYATPGNVARKAGGDISANWMGIYVGIRGETARDRKFIAHHTPCALNTKLDAERASGKTAERAWKNPERNESYVHGKVRPYPREVCVAINYLQRQGP